MHSVFFITFLASVAVMLVIQVLGRHIIAQRKRNAATQAAAWRQQRSAD